MKIFVLDTNVIFDSNSIHHFGKNDIVIPITVLEELDNFKRNESSIFMPEGTRTVDSLSSDMFCDGVSIGRFGRICIRMEVSLMKS